MENMENNVVDTENIEKPSRKKKTSKRIEKTVVRCKKVYVRSDAKLDAEPITTVDVNTKVIIDPEFQNEVFTKVILSDKTEGYIMTAYLA